MAQPQQDAIAVEIYGQMYQLSGVDPAHIARLATMVDGKMQMVAASGATVDSMRVAVLAALNLADELAMLQERHAELSGSLQQAATSTRSRAGDLMEMLDEVLYQKAS